MAAARRRKEGALDTAQLHQGYKLARTLGVRSTRSQSAPGYRFKNPQFYMAGSAARAEARRLDGSPSIWCCDLLVGQVEKLSPPHRGMTWKCR